MGPWVPLALLRGLFTEAEKDAEGKGRTTNIRVKLEAMVVPQPPQHHPTPTQA